MPSSSGGRRSPDEEADSPDVQPLTNNRPATAPMKAPPRKVPRTLERSAKKAPSRMNERARR